MRIPADALIPAEKLTGYLLVPRPWDDKAKFLAQAGFDRENPDALLGALRELAAATDAAPDGVKGGEEGCLLEVFNALGESIAVVAVRLSDIEPVRADEVLAVRQLAKAG
jgi:hypothetical protein